MKRAPRSRQRHDLYAKYHDYDSEISDLLGECGFKALQPGELFLFKLHAPNNFIVGGGVFSHASLVPLSLAWDAFGLKNGVADRAEMRARIAHYRRDPAILDERQDPVIGCRILTQPFFWPRDLWLPIPESWSPNIVTGKGFGVEERDGRYLWDAVADRLYGDASSAASDSAERYGRPTLSSHGWGKAHSASA